MEFYFPTALGKEVHMCRRRLKATRSSIFCTLTIPVGSENLCLRRNLRVTCTQVCNNNSHGLPSMFPQCLPHWIAQLQTRLQTSCWTSILLLLCQPTIPPPLLPICLFQQYRRRTITTTCSANHRRMPPMHMEARCKLLRRLEVWHQHLMRPIYLEDK